MPLLPERVAFAFAFRLLAVAFTKLLKFSKRNATIFKSTQIGYNTMHQDIQTYNQQQAPNDNAICEALARQIDQVLHDAESKIWHAHPVWFLDGNPIVGYSKLKGSVRLLFWSGQSFEEPGLQNEGKFKAAEARYTAPEQINVADLTRWLEKSRDIQWDYKNIAKRKGLLERLK